jgi:hypothetical protein
MQIKSSLAISRVNVEKKTNISETTTKIPRRQRRACQKENKLTGNRSMRLSNAARGYSRMGDRTVWFRRPAAQYTNSKRHRSDRLMSIRDIRLFSTSTLMRQTKEIYETLNSTAKLTWLIAREDFGTFTTYDSIFHSKCTTSLFIC